MAYDELVRALGVEVARQVEEVRAAARVERQRLLEETKAQAQDERARALSAERERGAARRAAALARAQREQDRIILVEKRRLLEGVRGRALAVLASDVSSTVALLEEATAGLPEGPLEIIVDPGQAALAHDFLASRRAERLERTRVEERSPARGGVEVRCARTVHDDTWESRLALAWPELEGRIADALFGGDDGAM